jgi:charged multivesicular body protein 4A/B
MSSLANFLRGKPAKQKETPNFTETIEKNNETTRNLQRKIEWIENKYINPNIAKIKALVKQKNKKNTEAAKKLLVVNRRYNTQIKNMEAQIENLTAIRIAIEGSLMTKNVFDTIQTSTQALRSTMPTIDAVEDIIADTEESITQTNEITEALSTPIQIGMPIDPDDLDDELRELMNEDSDENKMSLEQPLIFPNAPTTKLPDIINTRSKPIDNELDELLAFVN